ncbi:nonribosomal peptide synthase [Rickenella mellea]|uniref:Nonribosomal peptide synthase n=1 Tax=Rickenella mellea TaxID=50990 RepID=A0A4Y7QGV4_9AGAM|nr:nonribosomal peptide synthase [Rickenella mellea]
MYHGLYVKQILTRFLGMTFGLNPPLTTSMAFESVDTKPFTPTVGTDHPEILSAIDINSGLIQDVTRITPSQRDLYNDFTKPQWLIIPFSLPQLNPSTITLQKLQFTWQAVAAHNAILRAVITNSGDPDYEQCIVILRDIPSLSSCNGNCPEFNGLFDSQLPHMVVRVVENDHCLVSLHIPRMLVDDEAVRLIEEDFSAFYNGQAFAEHPTFGSYARDVFSRDHAVAESYWKERLVGVQDDSPPIHGLSSESLSASINQSVYASTVAPRLVNSLMEFEHNIGVEREIVFEAAWALVLSKHQSREDVIFAVSSPDAIASTARPVGHTEVTFPMPVKVSDDSTVHDLLKDLREQHIGGVHSAFVGYNKALAQADKSLAIYSRLKLARSSKSFTNDPGFPFSCNISVDSTIRVTLICNSDITPSNAGVLLDHTVKALEVILESGSDTTIGDQPHQGLVHELFEKQAALSPDAIALEDENGRKMTYAHLNSVANQVARKLSHTRGTIVPVCMSRSDGISLISSLLAVLKSGAAYVILDPDYPSDRLHFIINDVSATFVLTTSENAGLFECPVQIFENLIQRTKGAKNDNLNLTISSTDVAYIIYTSGSTGTPKGVVLEHGAASNGLLSARRSEGVRSLLFYNPVFSASQRTIFGTLSQGGCLCLASKESLTTGLSGIITRMNINTIGLTSTTAALLSPDAARSLKRITFIGEKVSHSVAEGWSGKGQVYVGYGLSECTQLNWVSQLDSGRRPNNIGRPTDTTSSYVLIPGTMRLAPILVPGELCLAGPQLARSYLNRPQETSEKFIKNPFSNGRLYRTGDMAMCLDDGSIEILGRIDMQVKISGQRIEPSEVAAVVRKHPKVESVAVVPATINSEVLLVACVTLAHFAGGWDANLMKDLREDAARSLPGFAIPSFWLVFDQLPMNSNGKVDYSTLRKHVEGLGRQGLVQMSHGRKTVNTHHEDLSPGGKTLLEMCASVLDLDIACIDVSDSFLNLGGSSLDAIRVATSCREKGWDVAVADIIRSASLRDLADALVEIQSPPATTYEPFSLVNEASITNIDFQKFEDVYPAVPLQEALVSASMSGSPEYLYQRVFNIQGADLPKLKHALESVFSRSQLLRTTFLEIGPSLFQAILRHRLPWEEHYETLDDFLVIDARRGVSLGDPFFRVTILPKQSLMVISEHHALFDYWSNTFALQDAASIYYGGAPATRPPYTSFVRHVLEIDHTSSRNFWSHYLDGATATRLGIAPSRKHTVERNLGINPARFLTDNGITSGALIYAAWALVLALHTASDDVTFGTALSGRDVPVNSVHVMAGPTLTTVPQRISVNGDIPAYEFVRSVQTNLWEMNQHAQYGMRNALRASGHSSTLFDTFVNILAQKSEKPTTLTRLFQSFGPRPVYRTEYITLEALIDGNDYGFRLISDLQAERATFIMDQFINAMTCIITRPQEHPSVFDIVSADERQFLTSLSPPVELPHDRGFMHTAFEKYAETTPHQVALQWESSETITYAELNSRANGLAKILREKDVRPDQIVPLCLEKSVTMIVSILAVLKAGGAYAPMDPENPPERNSFIVRDVEAKLVLTSREHAEIFTSIGVDILLVEELDFSGSWPNVAVSDLTPDHLAYIIYTSGSTGLPKGVLIQHGANYISMQSLIEREGCNSTWRTLMFSNYVFDASILDMFTTLGSGATLCVASTPAMMSDLAGCINSMGVNELFLTPTVAKLVSPEDIPTVRKIVVGGEAMTVDIIFKWASKLSLMNAYGPTETTVVAAMFDMPVGGNPRIVGKLFKTVSGVILEKSGDRLVPFGGIGELCLSGPQLARGYHKRPEINEKAFINFQGERLYRTGDLMRWCPDGELECFGRKDHQVKISGHRIELGEIEAAIHASEKVVDCVVVVADIHGKPQLVVFVIINNSSADSQQIILPPGTHAADIVSVSIGLTSLPPYMLPKIWIPVAHFPLMPSGKADRRKLLGMVTSFGALEISMYSCNGDNKPTEFVALRTEEEKIHQNLWATLLGIKKSAIGGMANFISFGGDSISAMNLVSQCRRAGFALTVGDVLSFPVLKEMASHTKRLPTVTKPTFEPVPYAIDPEVHVQLGRAGITEDDVEAILPCGPGQLEFRITGAYDEQYWMLQAVRPIPPELDFNRWQELTVQLTERNSILRTSYVKEQSGSWVQVILKSTALDVDTIYVNDDAEMERVIEDDWREAFVVGRPFVRYRLLVLPDGRRFILTKLDHGSYDGTLLRIFDSQFTAMACNQPVEEPVPFRSFVDHIARIDKPAVLEFWTKMLAGCNFAYPAMEGPPLIEKSMLTRKVGKSIDSFASKCGVTVPIVFQTTYTALLASLSGHTDVSYDNLVTGRDVDMDNNQLINGTTANFIPFRSTFSTDMTVKDLLKDTQSLFWKTTQNGTVSLTDIFAALGRTRKNNANKCLFIFKPFEPASGPVDHMRWLVMGLSRVRQPMNYALMLEVYKTADGYNLRLRYDSRVYSNEAAESMGDKLVGTLDTIMAHSDSPAMDLLRD